MNINYICESKCGLVRETNQDHADTLQTEDGFLAVVCDGVGGNNGGETASRIAVDSIIEAFKDTTGMHPLDRLSAGIRHANYRITEAASLDVELKGMATTVVVLYLDKNGAYWAHAGDSRIYFFFNGELQQLTKDHSLVQNMVDKGIITSQTAEKHPFKNIITRAVGEKDEIEIETCKMDLDSSDELKFLLCTDGVSGMISKNDIIDILSMEDLSEMDVRISNLVEANGATDNYTFIIISNK
ncbi:MAG: protein phosphatase 2C domain-containing protein [Bacteroidetes bacterium]|nr:protein phosphatase 2C domain-containing protein [Bacteroidota bacterium]